MYLAGVHIKLAWQIPEKKSRWDFCDFLQAFLAKFEAASCGGTAGVHVELDGVPGESTPTERGPRASSMLELDARRLLRAHGLALPGDENDTTGTATAAATVTATAMTMTMTTPDLMVECFASHPALGQDFIAYAHVIEILCEDRRKKRRKSQRKGTFQFTSTQDKRIALSLSCSCCTYREVLQFKENFLTLFACRKKQK